MMANVEHFDFDPDFEQRKMNFYLAVQDLVPAAGQDNVSMGSLVHQNLDEGVVVRRVDRSSSSDELVDDSSSQASSLFQLQDSESEMALNRNSSRSEAPLLNEQLQQQINQFYNNIESLSEDIQTNANDSQN